ncbi:MAG: YihY/virulence factor BrkB family protein [Schleiferiaceae bacterium]|nr:YihY/virulence factor BrkB family protein [Schleiferiaceae bacterium]
MNQLVLRLKVLWRFVVKQSKNIRLPFFDGLSLYDVSRFFALGIYEGSVTTRASSIAFSFFLALFPGIIFLFTLIPYISIPGFQEEIFELLSEVMPPDTYEVARSTIDDVLNHKRGDLLSFSFVLALILATNGTQSIMTNFTNSFHNIGYRNFWMQYLMSLGLTILLAILLLIGIITLILSEDFTDWLVAQGYLQRFAAEMITWSRGLTLIAIILTSISLLFYIGPTKQKVWRFISPGSILATTLIVISSLGFSYYIENFSQYNKLYGSIGTLMVIMIWIYINAIGLILGFELNASSASAKQSNQKELDFID